MSAYQNGSEEQLNVRPYSASRPDCVATKYKQESYAAWAAPMIESTFWVVVGVVSSRPPLPYYTRLTFLLVLRWFRYAASRVICQ